MAFQNQEIRSFPFEAGRRGKPDEMDSNIANLVGAYLLGQDRNARFNVRVHGFSVEGQPRVQISGEVSRHLVEQQGANADIEMAVSAHIAQVHKKHRPVPQILVRFNPQEPKLASNGHAGDSGNPIAVAYRHGPQHLPWERYLAVRIRDAIDATYEADGNIPVELQKYTDLGHIQGLKPDGKVSVRASYTSERRFQHIDSIVAAVEHEPSLSLKDLQYGISRLVYGVLGEADKKFNANLGLPKKLIINGLGEWHSGGWSSDEGSNEAKPHRDGFGPYGMMEDSFSGEDPSKPSGTGTFLARHIAKTIVANSLTNFARVELDYVIGQEQPDMYLTASRISPSSADRTKDIVRRAFGSLSIPATIERFGLRDPALYQRIVAASDYFQSSALPWEQIHPSREFMLLRLGNSSKIVLDGGF